MFYPMSKLKHFLLVKVVDNMMGLRKIILKNMFISIHRRIEIVQLWYQNKYTKLTIENKYTKYWITLIAYATALIALLITFM